MKMEDYEKKDYIYCPYCEKQCKAGYKQHVTDNTYKCEHCGKKYHLYTITKWLAKKEKEGKSNDK